MSINRFFNNTWRTVQHHSPEILTALGVSGVVTTAYLVGKASFEAAAKVNRAQWEEDQHEKSHPLDTKEKAKLVWKLYIPAGVSGAITVVCIIGASRASGKRTAAAVAAYSLTEKAFEEYKNKVVENVGENKEQKIRDEIAQDRVNANPPGENLVVIGSGNVLCCELYTMRYFRSEVELIKKAQNKINHMINTELWVTLSEFYELLGLQHTSDSSEVGWNSERGLLELNWGTAMEPNGREPCVTFEYSYINLL